MITLPEKITREKLLEYNSEEAYMARYTGIAPRKKLVNSPFRKDRHPSCSFMRTSSGRILLYDFSRPEYTCDFVKAAMMRYNCTYGEALKYIAQDYGILPVAGDRPKVIEVPAVDLSRLDFKKDTFIQITQGEWLPKHLDYWGKYGITLDILKRYRVYRPSCVFLNGNVIYRGDDNVFAYFYRNGTTEEGLPIEYWRIYFPGRKKMKFISTWNKSMIQGYRQLPKTGDTLVVTKSMKDVMCMASVGITAIAPNSENMFLPDEMVDELRGRFKQIIIIYDNDRAGLYNMAKIRRKYPEFAYVWIDKSEYGCKDFSDLYEKYGREKTIELIGIMRKHVNKIMTKEEYGTGEFRKVFASIFGVSTGNPTNKWQKGR